MKTPFRIKLILLWYKYLRKKVGFNMIKRISNNSKGVNNIMSGQGFIQFELITNDDNINLKFKEKKLTCLFPFKKVS